MGTGVDSCAFGIYKSVRSSRWLIQRPASPQEATLPSATISLMKKFSLCGLAVLALLNCAGATITAKVRVNNAFNLYADGEWVAAGDKRSRVYEIDLADTVTLVAIHAHNYHWKGCVLAEFNTGVVSDESWRCKRLADGPTDPVTSPPDWAQLDFTEDATWTAATVLKARSSDRISDDVSFIWSGNDSGDNHIACRVFPNRCLISTLLGPDATYSSSSLVAGTPLTNGNARVSPGDGFTVTCNIGYHLDTCVHTANATCLVDGTWSPPQHCPAVECGEPPSFSNTVQRHTTGDQFSDTTTYACEKGFAMNANQPDGNMFFLLRCTDSGIWSAPAVRCTEDCPRTLVGSSIGLKPLNFQSQTLMNIFMDKTFTHPGKLTAWRYMAMRSGEVYFSVWRRSGVLVSLLGSNKVSSPGEGLQSHNVPASEQISVETGDMIGVHYPQAAAAVNKRLGILYYEDSRYNRTLGIDESKFSRIIAEAMYDEVLVAGRDINQTIRDDIIRQVALEAVVDCETCIKTVMGSSIGLQPLNDRSNSYLNIFMSKAFGQSGTLVRWRYLAYRAGEVYFSVWRKTSHLELIGFNKVSCTVGGLKEYNVLASEQIRVEVGDRIGVHYPIETAVQDMGVLYYEDVRMPKTPCKNNSDLIGLVALPMFDDDLKVGKKVYGSIREDMTRDITIEADILTTSDCVLVA